MTDIQLWEEAPRLIKYERDNLVGMLIYLAEIHSRDLHLRYAYSSLYRYLNAHGFSEWESRARAIASLAARKYPSILGLLRSGRLNLYGLTLIGPFLNSQNYRVLLRKACRSNSRELQALVAEISPQAARRDVIRVVYEPAAAPPAIAQPMPTTPALSGASPDSSLAKSDALFPEMAGHQPAPAVPERRLLRFSFDGPRELDEMLRRARNLLFHKYPKGELARIMLDALNALLDKIDPDRRLERKLKRSRDSSG